MSTNETPNVDITDPETKVVNDPEVARRWEELQQVRNAAKEGTLAGGSRQAFLAEEAARGLWADAVRAAVVKLEA